jgi:Cu/Ag efflux pump CusA
MVDTRRDAARDSRNNPTAKGPVKSRIAAPMVGGMITAPILSMFVIPAAYLLLRRRRRRMSD